MTPSGINGRSSASPMDAGAMPAAPETGLNEAPEAPMDENQVCVDLQALGKPDENEQMEPPAPGDKVQMNVEGTVDRVTPDGKAYVTMTAVNGQEVKDDDEGEDQDPAEGSEDQQMASLQNDVKGLPEGY